MLSKVFFSILPGLLFCILFYLLDKNKSKNRLIQLILIFLIGGLGAYITYRVEWHFGSYFPKFKDSTAFQILIYAIFGVAIYEEGYKWLFTSIFTYSKKIKDIFSVIVYSVFCASGFATFENLISYTLKGDVSVAIQRMFTAVPIHICFAILVGLFIGLAKKNNGIKMIIYYALGLIIPMIVHAVSNWFIYKPGLFDIKIYWCYFALLMIICVIICVVVKKKE